MKKIKSEIAAAMVCLALLPVLVSVADAAPAARDESVRRGETRATLDPGIFSDPTVRKAYQVAREIPWVLDSIYCFCKCEESPVFRHKSLLSCYVDNHAAV